jgi:hypothetical protein
VLAAREISEVPNDPLPDTAVYSPALDELEVGILLLATLDGLLSNVHLFVLLSVVPNRILPSFLYLLWLRGRLRIPTEFRSCRNPCRWRRGPGDGHRAPLVGVLALEGSSVPTF